MISIIMAAYNSERTIAEAIDSVLKQTYTEWELLVIDDCSSDQTVDIVNEYITRDKRIRLFSNKDRGGVSKARYIGLQEARGEWVAVLDSDDKWLERKLELQMQMAKTRDCVLVFTASRFMDNEGNASEWILNVPEEISYKKLLKQNVISNSSVLVLRKVYEENYVFGDDMHEDFALWLNILKKGYNACGLNYPLLVYRLGLNTKSSNKIRSAKMNWKTYRYMKLNIWQSLYYMCHYTVNGIRKYGNLSSVAMKC